MLIPASFLLYLILAFGLGMNGALAGAVGRDPRLPTGPKYGRSFWHAHQSTLGTGYESFWLGPRLLVLADAGLGH